MAESSNPPYFRAPMSTVPNVTYAPASLIDLPPWMRDNLLNEYRAAMQRVKYLRHILGIAPGPE